jgi:hypothetical protein
MKTLNDVSPFLIMLLFYVCSFYNGQLIFTGRSRVAANGLQLPEGREFEDEITLNN